MSISESLIGINDTMQKPCSIGNWFYSRLNNINIHCIKGEVHPKNIYFIKGAIMHNAIQFQFNWSFHIEGAASWRLSRRQGKLNICIYDFILLLNNYRHIKVVKFWKMHFLHVYFLLIKKRLKKMFWKCNY